MPRQVSQTALQAMFAQQTGELFLTCLKITHTELPEPLRFVNDTVDLQRSDGVYRASGFDFRLPNDSEDNQPRASITIDNVDRQIIEAVRPLQRAPKIEVNIVLADTPDIVELGPISFKLKQFDYDAMTIQAELGYEEDFLNQEFPKYAFTPRYAPGLF